jgi:hypothetical protein
VTGGARIVVRVAAGGLIIWGLLLVHRACAVADLTLPPPSQVSAYRAWFVEQVLVGSALILLGSLALWRVWRRGT